MIQVRGENGGPDFLVGLTDLCRWTGYSDERLLQFARTGVVRRKGRGQYLLRASIRGLLDRSRGGHVVQSLEELLAVG